jgi:CheY-like chemotaxis protein
VGDDAVDTMIRNTLRALLLENDGKCLEGLESENICLRDFCVGLIGEKKIAAAAPALLMIAEQENDPEQLLGLLNAMSRIRAPEFLDVFRRHARSEDPLLSGISIRMLGEYRDHTSLDLLQEIVEANEAEDSYERCELSTWSAIEALAALDSPESLDYLTAKIHHKNPTARRLIHQSLADLGQKAVEPVAAMFESGNEDQKIMAANVLGFIGHKDAVDTLIRALERGGLEHNVCFAVYEALGEIRSMKALIRLLDSLPVEQDEAMLLAVLGALDKQVDPAVGRNLAEKIKEIADNDPEQWQRILASVVQSHAVELFSVLAEDHDVGGDLLQRIKDSRDQETIRLFRVKLTDLGDPRAEILSAEEAVAGESGPSMLAVDDSGAMRNFYRAAAGDLGMSVTVAENGRVAWDLLQAGQRFDIMVVDMNMPEMDGIELTTRVRGEDELKDMPIVMATTESEKSQALLAKKAGVNAFLIKPFKAEVLVGKIRKHLPEMAE